MIRYFQSSQEIRPVSTKQGQDLYAVAAGSPPLFIGGALSVTGKCGQDSFYGIHMANGMIRIDIPNVPIRTTLEITGQEKGEKEIAILFSAEAE
jgi:hypothetical protein